MSSEELGGTVLKCAFLFIYVGCSESNASSFFHGDCADAGSTVTLTDKVLSLKTFFLSMVTTIGCAFLPATDRSLHAMLVKIRVVA